MYLGQVVVGQIIDCVRPAPRICIFTSEIQFFEISCYWPYRMAFIWHRTREIRFHSASENIKTNIFCYGHMNYDKNFQINKFVVKINLLLSKVTDNLGHIPCEVPSFSQSNSWPKPPLRQHQPSVAKDHEDEENNSKGSET